MMLKDWKILISLSIIKMNFLEMEPASFQTSRFVFTGAIVLQHHAEQKKDWYGLKQPLTTKLKLRIMGSNLILSNLYWFNKDGC